MADTRSLTLLDLPSEILVHILRDLTTPSFIQTILTCHQLFDLAAVSRDVVLHHLHQVPGIKLGLEDQILTTPALFLILRQRAASSLYGANFHADCEDLRFQNGTLDATASCLADSIGGIDISLVMKESHVVRHYNTGGTIESHTPPYLYGDGKPVQVVNWKGTTSILYERLAPSTVPCGQGNECSSFHPNGEGGSLNEKLTDPVTAKNYYLVHHKSHMNDRPDLFHIPTPNGVLATVRGQATRSLVPLGLTIHNRLKFAVLWGELVKGGSSVRTRYVVNSKSSTTRVILYTCDRLPAPLDESFDLEAVVLYPIQRPTKIDEASPAPFAFNRFSEYLSQYRPRSIAFIEGGRLLKLYRAGSIAPYSILPSTITSRGGLRSHDQGFPRLRNDVDIGFHTFKIESPFFGQHAFSSLGHSEDEHQTRECLNVFLHVATTNRGFLPGYASDTGQSDLYVIQNRMTTDEDECEHVIDLDDTGRVPHDELRVVARLWGWNPSLAANSTLTAVDSVCISSKGTRIAIACWDRILVWALHPEIFCEQWTNEQEHDSTDSDQLSVASEDTTFGDAPVTDVGTIVGNGQADNGSDGHSDTASSMSNDDDDSPTQPAMVKATKFYDLVRHPSFGEIVELRPIVLKMSGGAIARKMVWSSTNRDSFDEPTSEVFQDLSDTSENDADRRSVRSGEDDIEHSSSRAATRRLGDLEDDTNPSVRLTEEDYLDQGPDLTTEEKGELGFVGAELESLVKDSMRSEASVPPARLGEGNSIPEELQEEKLDDEAAQADVEATPPLEHEMAEFGMNDAPQGATSSENVVSTDVLETAVQQLTPDGKQVQLYDTDFNPPQDSDNTQDFNLDFSTLDNTDVLENFDFDSFLNTTNEEPFNFDLTESVTETQPMAPDQSPARYDLDSRPPSPLEVRNTDRRRSERSKNQPGKRRKPKRDAEDELVVLTDRGLQVWNLGVWARGKRESGYLVERLP